KIAMISEHASPLAAVGGADAGGQNVHVAELSAALARRGHDVVVYTRRDDPGLPERGPTPAGYTVVRVPARRPRRRAQDELPARPGSHPGCLHGGARTGGTATQACQRRAAGLHGNVRALSG